MNRNFIITAGIISLGIAVIIYVTEALFFLDSTRIFETFLDNLAFLPISAFIVVVVIERVLTHQEKQAMLQKLNMVVGAFFSEVGNKLLVTLKNDFVDEGQNFDPLMMKNKWTTSDFAKATAFAAKMGGIKQIDISELENLKVLLVGKRQFLLGLLENPNLLEHEKFTDLLWAVFHFTEELEARESLRDLPDPDLAHLKGDLQRIYNLLVTQWLYYAKHLQTSYPFLFSLVVRTHPFQENPSASIKQAG
jgi:hypothetical protein